jgi:hypothetical protein
MTILNPTERFNTEIALTKLFEGGKFNEIDYPTNAIDFFWSQFVHQVLPNALEHAQNGNEPCQTFLNVLLSCVKISHNLADPTNDIQDILGIYVHYKACLMEFYAKAISTGDELMQMRYNLWGQLNNDPDLLRETLLKDWRVTKKNQNKLVLLPLPRADA